MDIEKVTQTKFLAPQKYFRIVYLLPLFTTIILLYYLVWYRLLEVDVIT